jgi:hypothetical protein
LEHPVRFPFSSVFHEERERFLLAYTCEHCVHFDPTTGSCVHGYPVADHVDSSAKSGGDLVFCKEFELA